MISTSSKLAVALGVIGAIALSVPSAEARSNKRSSPSVHSTPTSGPYVRQQSFRGAYNLAAPPMARGGGGINFSDGRMGANYNPNQ